MQRADTLWVLSFLMECCKFALQFDLSSTVKTLLVHMMLVISSAHLYDYTMAHASRHYFIRADLLFPKDSPYIRVLDTGNDMAYIQLVRMPRISFDYLLSKMDRDWVAWHDGYTDQTRLHRRPGRAHMLNGRDILALTLTWLGSATSMHHLELIFGVGHSVLQRDLELGLQKLLEALRAMPESDCSWPTAAEMEEYARAIEEVRGPCPYRHVRVWGWLDGLRLSMLNPNLTEVQRHWYNGWVGETNATNILVGVPTGKIVFAVLNKPGTTHDYTASRDIFEQMADVNLTPVFHTIAGDSAFASIATNDFISTKEEYVPPLADTIGKTAPELAELRRRWESWIGAVRQSTEHGMRSLQAVWGRLKSLLPTDNFKRASIIELAVRLNNFNAHYMTSHNQCQTMYLEALLR